MSVNYYREMQKELSEIKKLKDKPKMLLHSCCAPCSSHTINLLSEYFDLTVYYYNPNIFPDAEYIKRLNEQKRLCALLSVKVIEGEYIKDDFYSAIKGNESDFEGGERCHLCCKQRLEKTAEKAKELGYEYFTTTLSISPLKNAREINESGKELEEKYKVKYLSTDLKKKDGYLHSVELSKEYELYRQNYCGCEFSKGKLPQQ